MCGLAGLVGKKLSKAETMQRLKRMIASISHRGPDETSVWMDACNLCGLAHARLSIIDIEDGSQPISNEDGNITVVFNGEIYNHMELRKELVSKGHIFKTRTDTEVLVHLYEEEGPSMAIRLRGMFAIALWDSRSQKLYLMRDHIGKKPLHFFRSGNLTFFASEYKAFLGLPGFEQSMDMESLHYLLNLRWLPTGRTLMKGVEQVLPGEVITIHDGHFSRQRYWTPKIIQDSKLSEEDHIENILYLLKQAVRRRLVSDVPVGIFLSGGLDSSIIMALMAEEIDMPMKSFCLGFGNENDETMEASETAAYYGANHKNYMVDENPLRYYQNTIWHSEIPKVNSIQVNLLAQKAKNDVKVVMSGLGGDELFGGYDNYLYVKYGGKFADLPFQSLGDSLRKMAFKFQGGGKRLGFDQLRRGVQMGCSFGKRSMFYSILRNVWDGDDEMYSEIYNQDIAQQQKSFRTSVLFEKYFTNKDESFLSQVMNCELQEKLVGDQILVEDRNMMAHGLEGRAPFLDVDLIEYAAGIPNDLKINLMGGRKYILRKAMKKVLPQFIFDRPKKGFAFDPVRHFTRDLKPLAELVLNQNQVEEMGVFNYNYIRKILDQPPAEALHWHYWQLWTMVGVVLWHNTFIKQNHSQ